MEKIESKVARAILQKAEEIEIEGAKFKIEQPTIATIIELSALAAELPEMKLDDTIIGNALKNAKDAEIVGKMAALLVLGAKRIKQNNKVTLRNTEFKPKWSWKKMRKVLVPVTTIKFETEYEYLTNYFLDSVTPSDLRVMVMARLTDMQVDDFFVITASLKGTNLLKSTKEAEETALGE